MEFFCLDKEFDSPEDVLQAKIRYEANNVIFCKTDCHKIKGDVVKRITVCHWHPSCKPVIIFQECLNINTSDSFRKRRQGCATGHENR